MTAETLIHADRLARWYGPVVGVTDITLSIPSGIIGLLGPNGAGKSTLLKLMTGQIGPSSGSISILSRNPMRDPEVFRETGYCSEDDALFEDLTAIEMVRFLARLHGMTGKGAEDRAMASLETCGVGALADRKCQELSKGQRQRVRIAAAIVHEPRILILDEPMTGLDPIGRRSVMDLVRARARAGRTVIFSSHILHEVESVAEYVIVLNKGMVLAEGTLKEIREALSDYPFSVEVAGSNLTALAQRMVVSDHVTAVEWMGREVLRVSTQSARQLAAELPALIVELGIEVTSLTTPDESLDVLFGRLVARRGS